MWCMTCQALSVRPYLHIRGDRVPQCAVVQAQGLADVTIHVMLPFPSINEG